MNLANIIHRIDQSIAGSFTLLLPGFAVPNLAKHREAEVLKTRIKQVDCSRSAAVLGNLDRVSLAEGLHNTTEWMHSIYRFESRAITVRRAVRMSTLFLPTHHQAEGGLLRQLNKCKGDTMTKKTSQGPRKNLSTAR